MVINNDRLVAELASAKETKKLSNSTLDKCIEIVSRNTPKRAIIESDTTDTMTWDNIYCPNCNNNLTDENIAEEVNYCPNCGQALIW